MKGSTTTSSGTITFITLPSFNSMNGKAFLVADAPKLGSYTKDSVHSDTTAATSSSTLMEYGSDSSSADTSAITSWPSFVGEDVDDTSYSRTHQLRAKRRSLENWHELHKQQTQATMAGRATFDLLNTSLIRATCTDEKDSTLYEYQMTRAERQSCRKLVEQLQVTKRLLRVQYLEWGIRQERFVTWRQQVHAQQEQAATRLLLSKMDGAIYFYQRRLDLASMQQAVSQVPTSILNLVAKLSDLGQRTLQDDLHHALALLSDEYPQQVMNMMQKIKDLQSAQVDQRADIRLRQVGGPVPHFSLPMLQHSRGGSTVLDSTKIQGRSILVVYLGNWSTLCMTKLRAWQRVYNQHERGLFNNKKRRRSSSYSSHPLLAIGMEETSTGGKLTATKSGVKFPILGGAQDWFHQLGLLLLPQEHPAQVFWQQQGTSAGNLYPDASTTSFPMMATLVVEWGAVPSLLYSHVSVDPTSIRGGLEPMELAQTYFGYVEAGGQQE